MKSSNLAWRIEPQDGPLGGAPAAPPKPELHDEPRRPRPRARFERRTIEIRDQGFAPFRVR